jgi:hypothetical protein
MSQINVNIVAPSGYTGPNLTGDNNFVQLVDVNGDASMTTIPQIGHISIGGVKDLGFIAQDLKVVNDENLNLVYEENPDKLEASYGRLIPVLVKAIQDLSKELEILKNK